MRQAAKAKQNARRIIGSTQTHQPFYCQVDSHLKLVKYVVMAKNSVQKIMHLLYKRKKQAFKKIKKTILLLNRHQLFQEQLFYPKQFLRGNNQVIGPFLESLKNNKFDSYISLSLKNIKSKKKQQQINRTSKKPKVVFDQNCQYLTKSNEQNTKNQSNRTQKNQSYSIQFKRSAIKHLQFNKINKQTSPNSNFFTQSSRQELSQSHRNYLLQNSKHQLQQNTTHQFGLFRKFRNSKHKDDILNQEKLSPIKITYTCIQKNTPSTNREQSRSLQWSRVSQTFSSKSIKKERPQLNENVVALSDYLTLKVKKEKHEN